MIKVDNNYSTFRRHSMANQMQSVKDMASTELQKFFEGYIPLLIEKEKFTEHIVMQKRTIEQKKQATFAQIESSYQSEYNKHFVNEKQKKERKLNKIERRIFYGKPLNYVKTLFLLWLLTFVVFPELSGTDKCIMAFALSIPIYLFRKVIKAILQMVFTLFKKHYLNRVDKKCIRLAKKKGITKENLKQQGGYAAMREQAVTEYGALSRKMIVPIRTKIQGIEGALRSFQHSLPMLTGFTNIAELMVMYHAVQSGRADTWKESLNILSVELKHRELMTNMESLHSASTKIAKEIHYMSKQMDAIKREIAYSRDTMSRELQRLERSFEENNYSVVDVYHHKSK